MAGGEKFRLVGLSETICFPEVQRKGKVSVGNVHFRYVFHCWTTVVLAGHVHMLCL